MMQLQMFNTMSADFTQTVTLGTVPVQMRLVWNVRSSLWAMWITDAEERTLATVALVPNMLLLRQSKAQFPLPGDLLLVRERPDAGAYPTFANLGVDFNLYYLTEEEALTWEDLNGLG